MKKLYCVYVMYVKKQVMHKIMTNISKFWWEIRKMRVKKNNTWMIYKNLKNKMNDIGTIT